MSLCHKVTSASVGQFLYWQEEEELEGQPSRSTRRRLWHLLTYRRAFPFCISLFGDILSSSVTHVIVDWELWKDGTVKVLLGGVKAWPQLWQPFHWEALELPHGMMPEIGRTVKVSWFNCSSTHSRFSVTDFNCHPRGSMVPEWLAFWHAVETVYFSFPSFVSQNSPIPQRLKKECLKWE